MAHGRIRQERARVTRRFDVEQKCWVKTVHQPEIYKDICTTTQCCLICKEFSKGGQVCPKCGRDFISFGGKVKNPRKGNKKDWKQFITTYAFFIYDRWFDESIAPDLIKQIKQAEYQRMLEPRWGGNFRSKDSDLYKLTQQWVLALDKHLDTHVRKYRKK